jgi:hypothetical protein
VADADDAAVPAVAPPQPDASSATTAHPPTALMTRNAFA